MASMNARLSGMARFYLALAAAAALSASIAAQSPPSQERPPLGSSLTVDALGELPSSGSIFTLLDTSIPDVITDRVDTGGVSAGQPARAGAHGSTWTQTLFRLGDADITDPSGSGTPLLSPGVVEWDRVDVSTGIMPIEAGAPGLAVILSPRPASSTWLRSLDVFASPPFLNAGGATTEIPSIARINAWAHGNLIAGGPVAGDRLGAFVSAAWTRSSHFERRGLSTLDANIVSLFVNLTATPQPSNRIRLTGWAQGTRDPLANHAPLQQPTAAERDRALHAQLGWEHQLADGSAGFRAFGSLTVRDRTTALQTTPFVVIERLRDGPVPTLLEPGDGTDRVLNAGGRYHAAIDSASGSHHAVTVGAEVTRNSTSLQSAFAGRVGELIDGVPARAWLFTDPAEPSSWHSTTLSAFASDTIALTPKLTVDGAVRVESVRGYAGATAGGPAISWTGAYPRAGLHFALTDFWNIATFAQYARYAHRLPLRDLAYGDPTAPTADIYRWRGGSLLLPASLGPLVQRIGPGTGGSATFSTIDPALKRPSMNEMIFGFESRPHASTFVRMAAIARREAPLVGVVDVGVPESSYTTIGVPDANIDRIGEQDDQTLIFYNRSPSSFGADRYVLTNPADHVATFVGVDFVGEVHARRLFVIAGGTAGRSEGLSANRGFGVLENDAALLGEVFINPNARAHAQGRVFTERGYTIKTAMAYQFDRDVTFGLVGRYQDGQHFARLVVLDSLNQGPEAVRAFRNGRTRFTFSMTVDARLQKTFTVGAHRFTGVIDAYNVFNQALSVEETQVTGAGERQTSAVQPPRVIHIGVRIPF
jgi:hypothetical protein